MCVPGLSSLSQWEWMSVHLLAQVWCLLNEFDLGSEAMDPLYPPSTVKFQPAVHASNTYCDHLSHPLACAVLAKKHSFLIRFHIRNILRPEKIYSGKTTGQ